MTRCARDRRVYFIEEPIFTDKKEQRLDISRRDSGIIAVQPHLPNGLPHNEVIQAQMHLLDDLIVSEKIRDFVAWYYTPMALSFTRHLQPAVTVFDCMDELSLFKHAPKELLDNEKELLAKADVVFTGGQSLYEAKKDRHPNIHPFPSSIDFEHFAHARKIAKSTQHVDPADQAEIPHPRMGFFGVIDERLDIELVAEIAEARPDWQLILLGPVVKIDPETLPRQSNIHYLGGKDYKELPHYIAGWDVAMMPFARNDSTKFISPTKTPEYLAAGKTVVSTSIRDVVRPYAELGLVRIADSAADFIRAAAESGMDEQAFSEAWLSKVDQFLAQTSWDKTWSAMNRLIEDARTKRQGTARSANPGHVLVKHRSTQTSLLTNNVNRPPVSAQVALH